MGGHFSARAVADAVRGNCPQHPTQPHDPRTEDAGDPSDPFAGLAGLSMFLVPTYEEVGSGKSKKEAEQMAAWVALLDLERED